MQYFPNQSVAYDVGWQLPPTAYGNLGYAMLSSESLLDSVQVMERFWPLITKSVTQFTWHQEDNSCAVVLTLNDQLPAPLRAFWVEASLASWQRCIEAMLGESLDWVEYWVDYPEAEQTPPKQARVGTVRFNMPAIQLRFSNRYLEQRLPLANRQTQKVAIENCEKDIQLNGLDGAELVTRVRSLLSLTEQGYPSLEELSEQLNLSSRTLRRQLSALGFGYKSLLDHVRRDDATRLLAVKDLTIQKVSDILGYSEPASFSRVFRQWTGQSPQEFRRQLESPNNAMNNAMNNAV